MIVTLSVVIMIESAWLVYLKFKKASTEVKIVEITSRFEIPKEEHIVSKVPVRHISVVRFDYEKMLMNATETLVLSSPVYLYVLRERDVVPAIGMCGDYVLTRISTEVYSFLTTRECTPLGIPPLNRAYGIYALASRTKGYALAKMLDLRESGFPSFVVEYEIKGRKMFSTVIGAFPNPGYAHDLLETLDATRMSEILKIRWRGYVGCVAGCR